MLSSPATVQFSADVLHTEDEASVRHTRADCGVSLMSGSPQLVTCAPERPGSEEASPPYMFFAYLSASPAFIAGSVFPSVSLARPVRAWKMKYSMRKE